MSAYQPRLPDPVFLGFCAKRATRWPYPAAPQTVHIQEVASAAPCLAARPPAWIDRWDVNRAWCWNTAAAAWAAVPVPDRAAYRLYAYRAVPTVFARSGVPAPLAPHDLFADGPGGELPPASNLAGLHRLGFDIVEYDGSATFGCSPLSCNGMAERYAVNALCLLDDQDAAVAAATAFGRGGVEPGPYIIVEIWGRSGQGGSGAERPDDGGL